MTRPLTPPDCDVRSLDWFQFFHKRLRRSAFWQRASDQVARVSVELWCEAFEQVPAGSLPDDDLSLALAAGFSRREVDAWRAIKDDVLEPWTLAEDGRWYHPTVAEVALEAFVRRLRDRARKKGGDAARIRLSELEDDGWLRTSDDDPSDVQRKTDGQTSDATRTSAPTVHDSTGQVSEASPPLASKDEARGGEAQRQLVPVSTPPDPYADAKGSFARLWAEYPHRTTENGTRTKGSRKEAEDFWGRMRAPDRRAAHEGLPRFRMAAGDKPPDAIRYLRNRRWTDEVEPPPASRGYRPASPNRSGSAFDAGRDLAERVAAGEKL